MRSKVVEDDDGIPIVVDEDDLRIAIRYCPGDEGLSKALAYAFAYGRAIELWKAERRDWARQEAINDIDDMMWSNAQ